MVRYAYSNFRIGVSLLVPPIKRSQIKIFVSFVGIIHTLMLGTFGILNESCKMEDEILSYWIS